MNAWDGIRPASDAQNILLSTDGSEYSAGAVREAIKIAKKLSSALSVMTVIDFNPEFDAIAPQRMEDTDKETREHLETVKAWAMREGIDCDTIVHKNESACREIVQEAAKKKSTMIVMGRRGRTGLRRIMMGSVTAEVLGHAPCNVLIVPRAAQVEFKNVLVGTHGSKCSMAAAAEAISLAKQNGSELTIIAVVPAEFTTPTDIHTTVNKNELLAEKEMREAENHVKIVKDAAEKEGVSAKGFVVSGKPALAITEMAKERRADLIVVGSHVRTGIRKLFRGSVAERIIPLTSCAVLAVKERAKG